MGIARPHFRALAIIILSIFNALLYTMPITANYTSNRSIIILSTRLSVSIVARVLLSRKVLWIRRRSGPMYMHYNISQMKWEYPLISYNTASGPCPQTIYICQWVSNYRRRDPNVWGDSPSLHPYTTCLLSRPGQNLSQYNYCVKSLTNCGFMRCKLTLGVSPNRNVRIPAHLYYIFDGYLCIVSIPN